MKAGDGWSVCLPLLEVVYNSDASTSLRSFAVMLPSLEQLGIYQLTPDQRLVLARQIIDTVITERQATPLTAAQEKMLDDRLARYEANPEIALDWEDVLAATRERLAHGS
jgi:putative addiction module component (TIGR02574 family)